MFENNLQEIGLNCRQSVSNPHNGIGDGLAVMVRHEHAKLARAERA